MYIYSYIHIYIYIYIYIYIDTGEVHAAQRAAASGALPGAHEISSAECRDMALRCALET